MLHLNEIVVASQNKGKIKEISYILESLNIKILTPRDFNIEIPHSIEKFSTYEENAKAKGDFIFEKTLKPTLSDDSGLEVPSLGGRPGILSSRYAKSGSDQDNRRKLIKDIKDIPPLDRTAKFVCVLYLRLLNESYFFRGGVEGLIITEERGNTGFGYDPIFYYQKREKTFAEMDFCEKFAVSHRGIALRKFKEFLENYTEGGS